mgnify:CR=1 FL=1|jgi:hypothetical protein
MKYPRLRCPVCGMVVFLRNIDHGKIHDLDAFIYDIGGRGHIVVTKSIPMGNIVDFWINRLEEVLDWLDQIKGKVSLRVASQLVNLKVSGVSAMSVSTQTQEKLKLNSIVARVRLTSSKPLLRT